MWRSRRKRLSRKSERPRAPCLGPGHCHHIPPELSGNSIARTREDYDVLLNGLDAKVIGWTPDVGHIINAGMDPLETMKQYRN